MSTALELDTIRGLAPEMEQVEAICYGLDHDLLTNDQLRTLTDNDALGKLLADTGTVSAWRASWPAVPACPSWCSKPAGHRWEDPEDTTPGRFHSRPIGNVLTADVQVVEEEHLVNGSLVRYGPRVELYVADDGAASMMANDADKLSELLHVAAKELDRIDHLGLQETNMIQARETNMIQAWECAPVGLDGHRWPCPRAESAEGRCTGQGCGR